MKSWFLDADSSDVLDYFLYNLYYNTLLYCIIMITMYTMNSDIENHGGALTALLYQCTSRCITRLPRSLDARHEYCTSVAHCVVEYLQTIHISGQLTKVTYKIVSELRRIYKCM